MEPNYNTLIVATEGGVVDIVLNRPEKRNAMKFGMMREYHSVLAAAVRHRCSARTTPTSSAKLSS